MGGQEDHHLLLVLIALTPVMHAAHRRWGLAVPAAMAAAAAMVSMGVTVWHLRGIEYANYLLVWGSIHQWGFAWRDGILPRAGTCTGSPWPPARSAWPPRWSPAATRPHAPSRKPSAPSSRRKRLER